MTVDISVLKKYQKNILIETGTYLGETTKRAIECGYKKVYTIELQEYLYNQAKKNLISYIENNSITLLLGSSSDRLSEIMSKITEPINILLDAHIDGGNYRPGSTPDNLKACPLYEELEIIQQHHIKTHTIIIDDIRIVGQIGWGSDIYLDKLISLLKNINSNYNICYEKGETPTDVLVASI